MNTTASETNYAKRIENVTLLFKENEAMYLNQKYYLSPVGNEKSNSFEVFPLYSSKIILYPKGSQLEDAVLNFLTNFLLYLSMVLFEILYVKWISRRNFSNTFFQRSTDPGVPVKKVSRNEKS